MILRALRDVVQEKAQHMQQKSPEVNALKAWLWLLSMKTLLKLAQVCLDRSALQVVNQEHGVQLGYGQKVAIDS